ncbi:hypothetical protein [Caballeronia sp. S22]|uniref:hypothetical protein n=1 Tax=Caballeronia sp. S22 TaxID=3137182 RepID=UPI0035311B8A
MIARSYYDPVEDPHAATPGAMERYLNSMLDMLEQLALAHGSTAPAEPLRASSRQHGRRLLTAVTFRVVADTVHVGGRVWRPLWARQRDLQPVARVLKSSANVSGSKCYANRSAAAKLNRSNR